MKNIPIQPVPAQQLQVSLAGQNCTIVIYQKPQGLFVDLNSNGADVSLATIAQNLNLLVPISYTGFQGNLYFIDTQGTTDPVYTGLGSRYILVYVTAAEYASL